MSLFRREFARPSRAAFLATASRTFIYNRKIAILDLAARDIDNELSRLAEIARTPWTLVGHDRNYRPDCQ